MSEAKTKICLGIGKLVRTMFWIKFKIAFPREWEEYICDKIQHSGAVHVPLGGTSKLDSQCTHTEEGHSRPKELRAKVFSFITMRSVGKNTLALERN